VGPSRCEGNCHANPYPLYSGSFYQVHVGAEYFSIARIRVPVQKLLIKDQELSLPRTASPWLTRDLLHFFLSLGGRNIPIPGNGKPLYWKPFKSPGDKALYDTVTLLVDRDWGLIDNV